MPALFPSRRWPRVGLWILTLGSGLIAAALGLGMARPVEADVGPVAVNEHGYSLAPAQATSIQMISETVQIKIAPPTPLTYAYYAYTQGAPDGTGEAGDLLAAQVSADFLFHNPEDSSQQLTVGFPLGWPAASDLSFPYLYFFPLQGLRAFVNGGEVETRQETVDGAPWRVWSMHFPPGETRVRVTYRMPVPDEVGYVLHTGAPWAGPIGQADLIVSFPCPARQVWLGPVTPAGYTVAGHQVRWHFKNLEPSAADDLLFRFAAARCWTRQPERKVAALLRHGRRIAR